jgi:ABC-2 type transport system ATP-binding protein
VEEPGIEVNGLVVRYGEAVAVDHVSFSVPRGQICGYLGPNGAGKSTTLRALAGVQRPDEGTIRLAGHDLEEDGLAARRAVGYAPESTSLFTLLSPREHLLLMSDLHASPEEQAAERIEELLERFQLMECAERRIDTLSKGQTQKTLLAVALLHDPEVLLLDEPLSGLDVGAARELKDLLRSLAERGRAILFSSHVLDVVERVCDRVIILDRGRVVADGSTAELLAESGSLEEFFHAHVGRVRDESAGDVD